MQSFNRYADECIPEITFIEFAKMTSERVENLISLAPYPNIFQILVENKSPRGTHFRLAGPHQRGNIFRLTLHVYKVLGIEVIDKSLGFETAVHEEALRAINAEHVVAESIENVYAIPASRNVNRCLIPESTFYFEGPDGIFKFIEKRLKKNGHMVIVIAEGAGQDLLMEGMLYDGPTRSFGKQATPGCWFVDFTIDKGTLSKKANDGYKS
ncbi:hypothetical protein LWI28_022620 [Acer negundo]|uniref:Uncharacterized protein n=1 Tax=Acer negundo TaxID=4023 RepID=A0AAD5IGW7_ACENE|nr:hypothetical protein LWI28_022620 [Acer negundo]